MKLKTLVITVALLAGLSLVAYLRNRPVSEAPADPRVGKAVLDAETASKAGGLVITDQGKKVELARGADGVWRVTSYYGLPASFDKIARFVQDLNEAKVDRFVTSNPGTIARLEFKDSVVSIRDQDGKEIWSVTLGKTPDSGNGRFIRFGTEPKAFFSSLHAWLDTDSKAWASTALVPAKPEDIAKVEIPFDGGKTVILSRTKKDAPWTAEATPAGHRVAADKASSAVSTLTALTFSDTADSKDAAAAAASKYMRTFRLTTFDGKTLTVSLGRTPEVKTLKVPAADAKEPIAPPPVTADGKADIKPITPEFDTTPAGPVFAVVGSSDARAPINDLMRLRAFKVDDFSFTGLPQKADELFEPAPAVPGK
jgi:hypothetical protein